MQKFPQFQVSMYVCVCVEGPSLEDLNITLAKQLFFCDHVAE